MIIKLHIYNMILNLAILTFDSDCCNNKLHMKSLFTIVYMVQVKEQITYKQTNQKFSVIFIAVKFIQKRKNLFKFLCHISIQNSSFHGGQHSLKWHPVQGLGKLNQTERRTQIKFKQLLFSGALKLSDHIFNLPFNSFFNNVKYFPSWTSFAFLVLQCQQKFSMLKIKL